MTFYNFNKLSLKLHIKISCRAKVGWTLRYHSPISTSNAIGSGAILIMLISALNDYQSANYIRKGHSWLLEYAWTD
jgi:hypothetical protein